MEINRQNILNYLNSRDKSHLIVFIEILLDHIAKRSKTPHNIVYDDFFNAMDGIAIDCLISEINGGING